METKNLVVILGPTGVGKTELSLEIARRLDAPILSADSRQIYRELPVCTAAATPAQQALVPHYFVGIKTLADAYSAAQFEADALRVIDGSPSRNLVLCGGSMMYIDAVCRGIDDMPQADPAIRAQLRQRLAADGLEPLLAQLAALDPTYFAQVDRRNPQRVIHGLEMCLTTGRPFSSFRIGQPKPRPFRIFKIGVVRPMEELSRRIALRVDEMLANGLADETRRVYEQYRATLHEQLRDVVRNPGPTQAQPIPNLTPSALNTVGLKEMLLHYEGIYTMERAVERIVHNSRVYAKKQLTWFRRDSEISWFEPHQQAEIEAQLHRFLCCTT